MHRGLGSRAVSPLFASLAVLSACAHKVKLPATPPPPGASSSANDSSPLDGAWSFQGWECPEGQLTAVAQSENRALRQGRSRQLIQVRGSEAHRSFTFYNDPQRPAERCEGFSRETWEYPKVYTLAISGTEGSGRQVGPVEYPACPKEILAKDKRQHRYELSGDSLRILVRAEPSTRCSHGLTVSLYKRVL